MMIRSLALSVIATVLELACLAAFLGAVAMWAIILGPLPLIPTPVKL